jgi:hypothetical protein
MVVKAPAPDKHNFSVSLDKSELPDFNMAVGPAFSLCKDGGDNI